MNVGMERSETINKLEKLRQGEPVPYIKVVHDGEIIGKVENEVSLTVTADTHEAAETFLKLRGILK